MALLVVLYALTPQLNNKYDTMLCPLGFFRAKHCVIFIFIVQHFAFWASSPEEAQRVKCYVIFIVQLRSKGTKNYQNS